MTSLNPTQPFVKGNAFIEEKNALLAILHAAGRERERGRDSGRDMRLFVKPGAGVMTSPRNSQCVLTDNHETHSLCLCVLTHFAVSTHLLLLDAFPSFRSVARALRLRCRRCLHRCRVSRPATTPGCILESAAEHGCLSTTRLGWDAKGCDPNSERGGRWRTCVCGAARRSPRSSHGGPKPQRYSSIFYDTI